MSGLEPLCALGIFKAGLNTNYWLKKQAYCSKLDHQRGENFAFLLER
jgi:hypothetical protein